MRVRILGIGMGPHHLTPEVVEALAGCDYIIAADKGGSSGPDSDGLLAIRAQIAEAYALDVVAVPDPLRDRNDPADYDRAVREWHTARVDAYESVLRERGGTAAFLVWGDPSLYDSTIRLVNHLAERLPLEVEVRPGISAPQLLAARHRIVLHEIGQPVHITTARRLRADIASGQENVCVMLTGTLDLDGLEDWQIWWGANLGTESEELVAGSVAEALPAIAAARQRAKEAAGWVMDIYLLRAP